MSNSKKRAWTKAAVGEWELFNPRLGWLIGVSERIDGKFRWSTMHGGVGVEASLAEAEAAAEAALAKEARAILKMLGVKEGE